MNTYVQEGENISWASPDNSRIFGNKSFAVREGGGGGSQKHILLVIN